jgi:hypothetical protein
MALTQVTNSMLAFDGGPLGMRNRIINGDMRIDQRNAGASVTPTTNVYTLDRWQALSSASSKFSVQQNAGSVTPPAGFTNYLGVTSLSAYTPATAEIFSLRQQIEGYNASDLAWGTANAKAVVLSFWVRSSLTGTFGGVLSSPGNNYSYPFTYTITVANTWEQKTVLVTGPTAGTWNSTNGGAIAVIFNLGAGATYSGTAGSWVASDLYSVTGATSVVGTNGATFYITGVQLEVGTVATPFERRQYGQELALCQRYYFNSSTDHTYGSTGGTYQSSYTVSFPVQMRIAPTFVAGSPTVSSLVSSASISAIDAKTYKVFMQTSGAGNAQYAFPFTASAEL